MRRSRSLALILMLVVAGCSGGPERAPTTLVLPGPAEGPPVVASPPPSAVVPPPPPRQSAGAPGAPAVKSEAPASQAPAIQKPDFSLLIGRDFAGVEALLGPADRIQDVAPGKEWEYRNGRCSLVVRFYPDLKTLAYRVLSYAFDNEESATADDGRCQAKLAGRFRSGN